MRRRFFWMVGCVFLAVSLWLTRSGPHTLGGAASETVPKTVAYAHVEAEPRGETSRDPRIGRSEPIAKEPPPGDPRTVASTDISSQIREAEYWFAEGLEEKRSAPTLHGANRRQAFTSMVSGNGIVVSPFPGTGEDWTFGFDLSQVGTVSADREKTTVRSEGGREEWFRNTPEGIEHGMLLTSPPPNADGNLVLKFPIRTDLQPTLIDKNLIVLRNEDGATVLRYEKIIVLDAENREVPAELELTGNGSDIAWNIRHQGFAYPLRIDPLITREQPGITDFYGRDAEEDFYIYEIQSLAMGDRVLALVARQKLYIYVRNAENGWSRVETLPLTMFFDFETRFTELQFEGDNLFLLGRTDGRSRIIVLEKNFPTAEGWGETARILPSAENQAELRQLRVKDGLLWFTDGYETIHFHRKDEGGPGNWGEVTDEVGSGSDSEEIRGSITAIEGSLMAVSSFSGHSLEIYRRHPEHGNRWQREEELEFREILDVAIVGGQLIVIDARHSLSGEPFYGNGAVLVLEFSETWPGHGSWNIVQSFRPCLPYGPDRPLVEATLKIAGGKMAVVVREGETSVSLFSRDARSRWHPFGESIGVQDHVYERPLGANFALTENAVSFPDFLEYGQYGGHGEAIVVREFGESGQRSYLDTEVDPPEESPGGSPDVALSGEHMIVGLLGAFGSGTPGAVYVFERRNDVPDAWIVRKKLVSGEISDSFGKSVEISGDTLAIAAPNSGRSPSGSGKVFVFDRNKGGIGAWGLVKTIIPPFAGNFSEFGGGLSLFQGRIAVSAVDEDFPTASDVIFIFEENLGGTGTWGKRAFIVNGEARSGDSKFTMPALFGDALAVVNPLPPDFESNGTLSVYREDEGGKAAWGREYVNDWGFPLEPTSLSMWGSRIAVGCSTDSWVETFLFIRGAEGSWESHPAHLNANGSGPYNWGHSVALYREFLVASNPFERYRDEFGIEHFGNVSVFKFSEADSPQLDHIASFSRCDTETMETFGHSVAVFGDTVSIDGTTTARFAFSRDMGLLEEWRAEAFGGVALADPEQENSLWGDLADPDGDGVKNIEEAYFDTLPKTQNLPSQTTPAVTPSALRLTWKRPPNFHGVRAIPQWSADLKDWYGDGEGPPGGTRNITVSNRGVADATGVELLEAEVTSEDIQSIFLRLEYRR